MIIGANADSLFQRLMAKMGRRDLGEDPAFANNAGRVTGQEQIDAAIAEWTATLTTEEAQRACDEAQVPCGPIYSIRHIAEDPHFIARGAFEEVETGSGPLKVPAISPKLTATPGGSRACGPAVGAHSREVLVAKLQMHDAEFARLKESGVGTRGR